MTEVRTFAPIEVPTRPYHRLQYAAGIDGLRALSVLAVLAYHLDVSWAQGGYLGVEAFFVISGFLITRLLLDEQHLDRGVDRRRFWIRRARRLLPAAIAVIVASLAWAAFVLPAGELRQFRGDGIASLFYVENWKLIVADEPYFAVFGRPSPLRHLWSLAIEEQFYLLWPLVLPLFARWLGRARTGTLILVAAIVSMWRMGTLADIASPERAYYGTDTRAFGILFGAVLACWLSDSLSPAISERARRSINRASLVALATLVWQFATRDEFDPWTYPWGFAVVDLATVVLIVSVLHPASGVGRRLGNRMLAALGRRSYSLYLWHWPVIVSTRAGQDWGLTGGRALFTRLVLIAALTEVSYRWIEQPFRAGTAQARIRTRWSTIRTAGWAGPVVATTILLAVAMVGSLANAPDATDQVLARAEATTAPTATAPATTTAPTTTTTTVAPAATVPVPTTAPPPTEPPPPPPSVTVIGESVTLGAAPELSGRYGDRLRIDAAEGRSFNDSVNALQAIADAGQIGEVLVVHLGNNGAVPGGALERILAIAAGRPIVMLTVHVPRRWEGQVNESVTSFAAAHESVSIQDWHAIAATEPGLLIPDGVHLTDAGAARYAEILVTATG